MAQLFPTTVIGSMPRPPFVIDLFRSGSRIGENDAAWQRRMDDAVPVSYTHLTLPTIYSV